jgi:hypothetical protein
MQYSRDDLIKMNKDYALMVEGLKIDEITEKIKTNVLYVATHSTAQFYHWCPDTKASNYTLPTKRILVEVCNKLRSIFIDSDIRIVTGNSISITWY